MKKKKTSPQSTGRVYSWGPRRAWHSASWGATPWNALGREPEAVDCLLPVPVKPREASPRDVVRRCVAKYFVGRLFYKGCCSHGDGDVTGACGLLYIAPKEQLHHPFARTLHPRRLLSGTCAGYWNYVPLLSAPAILRMEYVVAASHLGLSFGDLYDFN